MLMCRSQCPQSYGVYGIKIQSLVSLVTFLLGSGHSSVHIALVSILYTVVCWCWGEMSTVYVLPELDLPQQQRHVNINLMLHKLLPSWKVFMETLLLPACRILTGKSSSCTELQSRSRLEYWSQATTKYSWMK